MGFLPGDIAEKFAPYFRPVYDILLRRLGSSLYAVLSASGNRPLCLHARPNV